MCVHVLFKAWCIRCSSCATVLNGNRAELLAHYQSDWHQLNSLRAFNGCAPLSEDKIGDNLQFSEFYDISDAPLLKVLSSKKNVYFLHEKHVYSIYRCILHPNEQISDSVFRRPLDCAIIMLTAGHFAGAIFKCSEMIEHKTFHRYVVRAKQGARQSKADSRQSSARSVGAQLRRSNEKLLKEEIKKTVTKWSDLIDETPLIFIRCAESDKSFFTSDHSNGSLFLKSDQRIRTIPFVTYRADLHEVRRIWRQLR
ncbi:unnamed protein product [Dracunculus medinensis]|uniref:VLRF1 domain-containing protein n=1 Tax=Dracunculus medinensis TaxID=318479 RepID=A0A3P7QK81_DRAME|nr:unnamed protein product [Dracunculus medinensis]